MDSGKKNQDDNTFREAMDGVTPLRAPDRIEPVPKRTPARAFQREKDDREAMRELLEFDDAAAELETGEELLYLRPGHQKRVLRRLRRGHYSVSDTIDLHYMDVETAKTVLLDSALDRGLGCVRIVHGKGLRSKNLPRIKMMTRRILRKHPRVVAFASCRPVDGGTGAADVLLSGRPGIRR